MPVLRLARWKRASLLRLTVRVTLGGYAAFAGLNAQAADLATLAPAFGNTVLATYPDGRSQKIWLHPDGSWDGLSRKGSPLAGRWQLKGSQICMRQMKPPTLPISFCTPFPTHTEPGVQWASRDVAGNPIKLTLLKGMPPPPAAR
jgi:hypothetical protein